MIKKLHSCLCCGKSKMRLVLDLGDQPLANSYLQTPTQIENLFPLALNFCEICTHLQLTHQVDPDLLFKNYIYVSGTAKTNQEHFQDFVQVTKQYMPEAKTVLDIACNDGTQLKFYKEQGYVTYGIDPAKNLLELSNRYGNIVCNYLTTETIRSFNTKFDIIIAQNVFAHVGNPLEFLNICKSELSDSGRIFIQTSQSTMLANSEYDTVYHEHISFFNMHSMLQVITKAGLVLLDVINKPIHGNSYIFIIGKQGNSYQIPEPKITISDLDKYSRSVTRNAKQLVKVVNNYKNVGYKIVGYGAAAKGNTVLNYTKLGLDYIVDDNPLKHKLYTPGQRIPVVSKEILEQETVRF